MRTSPPIWALLLAACSPAADGLVSADKRDPLGDTDFDRPLPDSEPADTDRPATDPPGDTSPLPVPDSDTFDPADSDDTAVVPTGPVLTTVPNVHLGLHRPGDVLEIHDVVVTAVRKARVPPASNAFVVQDPTRTRDAGLYVYVKDTAALPEPGDLVTVVGLYDEVGVGPIPTGTLARLTVHPTVVDTSFTITGTAPLPSPEPATLATLLDTREAEELESMIVVVDAPGAGSELEVVGPPSFRYGDFPVSVDGGVDTLDVVTWFYDLRNEFSPSDGDTLASLGGVLYWEGADFNLAPRGADDAVGIVER